MPHQVGVGVPGGLNMWATVVEAMLQRDHEAAALSRRGDGGEGEGAHGGRAGEREP